MGTNRKLFELRDEIAWCPGCGNYGILDALTEAMAGLGLLPHQVLIVSGIGQSSKTPHYVNVNGFNGLHGRALPVALGAKTANMALNVFVTSGDGDTYGEGGNHLIHNIRRNPNIVHLVHNNQIYGLTKGQGSPTTDLGHKTSMQLDGVYIEPLNPISFAISLGCSFVARSYAGDKEHLIHMIKKAHQHKGYALVDILQPCVVFNKINTYGWYKDRVYRLDETYDPTDKIKAFSKSQEWGDRIPIGIIYRNDRPTYDENITQLKEGPLLVDREFGSEEAKKFMDDFV